jgi:hypothetical protein
LKEKKKFEEKEFGFHLRYLADCEITSFAATGTSMLNIFSNPATPSPWHSGRMLLIPNSLLDT